MMKCLLILRTGQNVCSQDSQSHDSRISNQGSNKKRVQKGKYTVFKGKNKEMSVYGMTVYVENLKEFTKRKKKKKQTFLELSHKIQDQHKNQLHFCIPTINN